MRSLGTGTRHASNRSFIATFLVRITENSHAPAAYVIIAAIITLIVLLRTRETAFAPLR
jgi:MHS family proline/betaine transporter-like MFS transporter